MAKAKKLPSGSWRCLAFAGTGADGKRKYKSFTADTKKEAELLAAQFSIDRKDTSQQKLTLTQAIDKYIESKSNTLSPSTIRGYRIAQRNAYESIKHRQIDSITEITLQAWANENAPKYSSKSIQNQFGLITVVLRQNKIKLDFDSIMLKPKEKSEYNVPDVDTMGVIIEAVRGKNIEIPVLLALMLGLRQSEIAGLKWEDYDGENIHIHSAHIPDEHNKIVRKERAKSYAGNRTILNIPTYLKEKLNTAERKSEYISPYRLPSSVLSGFHRLTKSLGLPPYKMHELRHANASLMLLNGTADKYAMERLGQSTPSMIKNVYQHTFRKEQEKVAESIDTAFQNMLKK